MPSLSSHVPLAHNPLHVLPLLTFLGFTARTARTRPTLHDMSGSAGDDGYLNENGRAVYFWCCTVAVELSKYCKQEMSQEELEGALEAAMVLKGM